MTTDKGGQGVTEGERGCRGCRGVGGCDCGLGDGMVDPGTGRGG